MYYHCYLIILSAISCFQRATNPRSYAGFLYVTISSGNYDTHTLELLKENSSKKINAFKTRTLKQLLASL